MNISIGTEVLVVTGLAVVVWLLIRFVMEPRARKDLRNARGGHAPQNATRLSGLGAIRSFAACAAIAGALTCLAAFLFDLYMQGTDATEEGLASLVAVRDGMETAVDQVRTISLELWIVTIVVLGLILLFAQRGETRKRWNAALGNRRKAIEASVGTLTGGALVGAATETDPQIISTLDSLIAAIRRRNETAVKQTLETPAIQLSNDRNALLSISNLQELEATFRTPLSAEEAAEMEMDIDEANAERLAAADALSGQIAQLLQDGTVEVETLNGRRDVNLAAAVADVGSVVDFDDDRERALRNSVIEARMKQHDARSDSRARAEPEFFHEWLAATASGEVTVKTASWLGKWSRRVAVVAIFLGMVGLGARIGAPTLIGQAKALELTLGAEFADTELSRAIAARPPETEPAEQLASDAETVQQLQSAMRASAARALQAGQVWGGTPISLSRRNRFDLATVEARQQILRASQRPTPSLDSSRPAVHIAPNIADEARAARQLNEILDESLERRIKVMRRHEPTWTRLRAAAARPAPRDMVSSQILKAILPGTELPAPHAMRAWAEMATNDFARTAVRTGSIPHGHVVRASPDMRPQFISARDQRLLADYKAEAPRHVANRLDDLRNGRIDPGSLHRAMPDAPLRPGGGGAYGRLFPTGSDPLTSASPGSGPDRSGSRTSPSGGQRVAAAGSSRSYTRVRFNRRVGGVVIGRMPDENDAAVSVTGFNWAIQGDSLSITLDVQGTGRVDLGTFYPAIAHHALAYAADGRVVTSTLPQVQAEQESLFGHTIEVPTRQVIVHPAFEDTAFACPAIEIDRFVDRFLYGTETPEAEAMVRMREAVTDLGTALNYAVDPRYHAGIAERFFPAIAAYAKACGTGANCFPVSDYQSHGLNFGRINPLLACMKSSAKPESACLSALRDVRPRASYSVDSGVREQRYRIDSGLTFLQRSQHIGDPLWPLNFIIQAVPVSLTEREPDLPDDMEPWVFPQMRENLRKMIGIMVANDPSLGRTLEAMQQFTVLQRLFRLALSGDLGFDFPIAELVAMQEETRPFVKVHRHEHWNVDHAAPFPAFVEMLRTEEQGLVRALRSLATEPSGSEACRQSAQTQIAASESASWPEGKSLWPTVGEALERCSDQAGVGELQRRMDALRRLDLIDEAIAISEAYGQERAESCPPL